MSCDLDWPGQITIMLILSYVYTSKVYHNCHITPLIFIIATIVGCCEKNCANEIVFNEHENEKKF